MKGHAVLATWGLLLVSVAIPGPLLAGPEASNLTISQTITVTTDDDSVHTFISVEPWAQDFIKGTRADGGLRFLPAHRIRSIRTVGDVTDRVLVDNRKVGREPESTPRIQKNQTLTLRGYPYPETKWFFILNPGVLVGIGGDDDVNYVFVDWGVMRNLGPRWAVGANLHSRLDIEEHGIMLRGRRWWNRSISTDLAAGFQGGHPSSVWLAQGHLNLGNIATFTLEMHHWNGVRYSYDYYPTIMEEDESRTSWKAGGSLSYIPGLIALALALGAAMVATLAVYAY